MDKYNHDPKKDDSVALIIGILLVAILWPYRHYIMFDDESSFALIIIFSIVLAILLLVIVRRKDKQSRKKILDPSKWDRMDGLEFENQIKEWLLKSGYGPVKKTEYFDQGVDLIAAKKGCVTGVQVKRSAKPVGVNAIRAVVAGLKSYGCNRAMVVTNSTFTRSAIKLAELNNCQLIDGQTLKTKRF